MAGKVYIGTANPVPIYEEVEVVQVTERYTIDNASDFFTSNASIFNQTNWSQSREANGGVRFTPTNLTEGNSSATIKQTATRDIDYVNVGGYYRVSASYNGSFYIKINGEQVLLVDYTTQDADTTVFEESFWSGSVVSGTEIEFHFSKNATNGENLYLILKAEQREKAIVNEIVGYEPVPDVVSRTSAMFIGIDDIARQISKAYIGVNGVACLFYSHSAFGGFTGDFEVIEITNEDGNIYELYALKNSGQLTISGPAYAWICGGGGSGGQSSVVTSGSGLTQSTKVYSGGGGSGAYCAAAQLEAGDYTIQIGSGGQGASATAGSATTIQDSAGATVITALGGGAGETTGIGASGGTGGGAGYTYSFALIGGSGYASASAGTGDTKSKHPYDVQAVTLDAYCAGGAGGSLRVGSTTAAGGTGGTNGGDGNNGSHTSDTYSHSGAPGGEKGGGNGGAVGTSSSVYAAYDGSDASFYGSGGGGGGVSGASYSNITADKVGGSGYAGVALILLPKVINKVWTTGATFTGTNTIQTIQVGARMWNVMTMTDSGTLSVDGDAKVFLVGGGSGGDIRGGSGGFVFETNIGKGEYVLEIGHGGAAQQNGSITKLTPVNGSDVLSADGGIVNGQGGSGGGGSRGYGARTGAGVSTIPFGMESLGAHSAGGGGGGYHDYEIVSGTTTMQNVFYVGGDGGSDGSNGSAARSSNSGYGGGGGVKGGGKGGRANGQYSENGSNATFYGSGGGGGAIYSGTAYSGGTGYQGVAYAAWVAEE